MRRLPPLFHTALRPLAAALLAAACTADPVDGLAPDDGAGRGVPVRAMLTVDVRIGGAEHARSRAGERTMEGTEEENRIRTLTLFAVPVVTGDDGQPREDPARMQYATGKRDGTGEAGGPFTFTLETRSGRKHIYIGANLTAAQRARFLAGGRESLHEVPADDHTVKELADPENGFTMFGQATLQDDKAQQDIDITTNTTPENPLQLRAALDRAAVKVLLLLKTADQDNKDDEDGAFLKVADTQKDDVWMRFDAARYMLNNINRYPYFVPHTTEEGGAEVGYDSNFHFFDHDGHDGILHNVKEATSYIPTYKPGMDAQFIHNEVDGLRLYPEHGEHFHNPERHIASRLKADAQNPYTEGIYCTENFASYEEIAEPMKEYVMWGHICVRHMLTYVRLTVKVIPRRPLDLETVQKAWETDKAQSIISPDYRTPCASPEEATGKLTAEADPDGNVPPETVYYYPPKSLYFTYRAMKYLTEGGGIRETFLNPDGTDHRLTEDDFRTYKDGREYYISLIDGGKSEKENRLVYSPESGLRRNGYYLLTVNSLSFPDIHTSELYQMTLDVCRYEWTDAGRGELLLE